MILGQELFGERGELLLAKGVPITGGQIETLTSLGCTSVVVDDEESRGIHLPQLVSNIVRFKTATRLTKTMTDLRGITAGMLDEDPVLATAALDSAFTTGQFRRQIREVDPFANLIMEVQELVEEVMHAERLDGLDPLVLHHDYALEQSIDSAIVAAMIGKTIGLPRERLYQLTLGALLHDVGMILVPEKIVNKPTALTDAEREIVHRHPALGWQLLRESKDADRNLLAHHVCYQHHERQDGKGYPRGLVGDNKLDHDRAAQYEPGTLHLFGEIGAVADIYAALSSRRPFRNAYPPDEVFQILHESAGTRLNSEIVAQALGILAMYPTGTPVEMLEGPYAGCRGIVAHVDAEHREQPIVRITRDVDGRLLEAFDVDTAETGWGLRSVRASDDFNE
jgi:HD-GYP domain-containing protein (c-di-GMP phosphodiesterase class II)